MSLILVVPLLDMITIFGNKIGAKCLMNPSNLSNSPIVPLFIDVCDFIENRVCVDFASISAPVIIFKILFQRTLVLLLENFLQFAFIRSF